MKNYILWVTTNHDDGGFSSRWYGWSENLLLTYDEALIKKSKIRDKFSEVEIIDISKEEGEESDS